MHSYASDSFFRGPNVYFAIGVVAIAFASFVQSVAVLPPLAGMVDPAALSAGAVYGFLILIFEKWIWRLLPAIPDLTGTWVGTIASSHGGGTNTECVMRVRQTWTRMAITLETEKSASRTTMAALFTDQPGDNGLKYEFISEPKNRAVETMHPHRGVCMLQLVLELDKLRGDYFTGRGRQTHGEINIARVSREQLSFEAALEAKQQ